MKDQLVLTQAPAPAETPDSWKLRSFKGFVHVPLLQIVFHLHMFKNDKILMPDSWKRQKRSKHGMEQIHHSHASRILGGKSIYFPLPFFFFFKVGTRNVRAFYSDRRERVLGRQGSKQREIRQESCSYLFWLIPNGFWVVKWVCPPK